MAQNSKIWGGQKIQQLFDISKILKNWHFLAQQMANWSHQNLTYVKIDQKWS